MWVTNRTSVSGSPVVAESALIDPSIAAIVSFRPVVIAPRSPVASLILVTGRKSVSSSKCSGPLMGLL